MFFAHGKIWQILTAYDYRANSYSQSFEDPTPEGSGQDIRLFFGYKSIHRIGIKNYNFLNSLGWGKQCISHRKQQKFTELLDVWRPECKQKWLSQIKGMVSDFYYNKIVFH